MKIQPRYIILDDDTIEELAQESITLEELNLPDDAANGLWLTFADKDLQDYHIRRMTPVKDIPSTYVTRLYLRGANNLDFLIEQLVRIKQEIQEKSNEW